MVALKAKLYNQETEMIKNGMEVTIDTSVDVYKNDFKANTITLLQLFLYSRTKVNTKIEMKNDTN